MESRSLIDMISDYAGFQYTPKFKSFSATAPPSLTSSGASTPVRKFSESPPVESMPPRRHSVIITVGVTPIPRGSTKT